MPRGRKRRATTCGDNRKVRYRDRKDAKQALAAVRIGAQMKGTTPPIRVYHCPRCNGWHMTALTIDEYEERREAWGS